MKWTPQKTIASASVAAACAREARASRRRNRRRPGPRAPGSCGRGSRRRALRASARTSSCSGRRELGECVIEPPGRRRVSGRECVSAPTETKSTPVSAIVADGVERDAARGLGRGAAGDERDRVAELARATCCRAGSSRRRRRAPRARRRASRTRPRRAGRGPSRARRRARCRRRVARWLSLIRIAS